MVCFRAMLDTHIRATLVLPSCLQRDTEGKFGPDRRRGRLRGVELDCIDRRRVWLYYRNR